MANLPNYEFIRNRSFEISWAIFRCTALFKSEKLKKELENSAVDLTVNYDRFDFNKSDVLEISGQLPYIEKTILIIKLAEAASEINAVNAKVLYRELSNLAEVIKKDVAGEIGKNKDVLNIENMFLKLPAINQQGKNNSADSNDNNKKENGLNTAIRQEAREVVSLPNYNSANSKTIRQEKNETISLSSRNSANEINKITAKMVNSAKDDFSVQESWQELIYKKIREIGKTSTKELCAYFPHISERTIRFYLQRLVENNLIDRIGSTGPGSYYVFKSYEKVA